MDEYIKRKPIRLANYDYAAPGAYFVTVCTYEKRCILSGITAGNRNDHARVDLSPVGRITEEQLMRIPRRFPCVTIDKYVIMPNHIHVLLTRTGNETGGACPSRKRGHLRAVNSGRFRQFPPVCGACPPANAPARRNGRPVPPAFRRSAPAGSALPKNEKIV